MSNFTHKVLEQIETDIVTVDQNPEMVVTNVSKTKTPLHATIEYSEDRPSGMSSGLNSFGWDSNGNFALHIENDHTVGVDMRYRVFEVIV